MKPLTIFFLMILFSGCFLDEAIKPNDVVGMRPIYVQIGDDISLEAIQFNDLTSIVLFQELILAMEVKVGIHIIDNTDPENPINKMFIPILGLIDIAVKEDIIIANTGGILYSVDISDRSKAILKAMTREKIFGNDDFNVYPIGYNGLFECYDPNNGLVVNWELVEMTDSDCWR